MLTFAFPKILPSGEPIKAIIQGYLDMGSPAKMAQKSKYGPSLGTFRLRLAGQN
jgi:hypothetical protein